MVHYRIYTLYAFGRSFHSCIIVLYGWPLFTNNQNQSKLKINLLSCTNEQIKFSVQFKSTNTSGIRSISWQHQTVQPMNHPLKSTYVQNLSCQPVNLSAGSWWIVRRTPAGFLWRVTPAPWTRPTATSSAIILFHPNMWCLTLQPKHNIIAFSTIKK